MITIVEGVAEDFKKVRVAPSVPTEKRLISKHGPYMVVLKPSVMEHEGMYYVEKKNMSFHAAHEWIKAQEGLYYGPGCYIVVMDNVYVERWG